MITDAIISLVYDIFMFFLGSYEPLTFNIDTTVFSTFSDFLAFIFYILPMDGLMPMVTIFAGLMMFRIVVSVIKTIWDLLPVL